MSRGSNSRASKLSEVAVQQCWMDMMSGNRRWTEFDQPVVPTLLKCRASASLTDTINLKELMQAHQNCNCARRKGMRDAGDEQKWIQNLTDLIEL